MESAKNLVLKYKYELVGCITGAIAGWCYWYFVGCSNGACMITAHPVTSVLYGALVGSVCFSLLKSIIKRIKVK